MEEETFRIYHDKKYEDFELSELQQAYLVGRKSEMSLGCVSAHGYLELECNDYDHDKFLRVLKKLVDRHEMLRCVICYEGNQHFVKNIGEINIPVNDIRMMSLNEKKRFFTKFETNHDQVSAGFRGYSTRKNSSMQSNRLSLYYSCLF